MLQTNGKKQNYTLKAQAAGTVETVFIMKS